MSAVQTAPAVNVAALEAEIARLRAQLAACKEQHTRRDKRDEWRETFTREAGVSSTAKLVALAFLKEYNRLATRDRREIADCFTTAEPALAEVFYPNVARIAGVSKNTVSECLKQLEHAGAVRRSVRQEREGGSGLVRNHVDLAPTLALLQHPETIQPPENAGRHGDPARFARICPSCHSQDIHPIKQYKCHSCGVIFLEPLEVPADSLVAAEELAPEPEPAPEPDPQPDDLEIAQAAILERYPVPLHPTYHVGDEPPAEPCPECGGHIYAHTRAGGGRQWACRVCWPALTL